MSKCRASCIEANERKRSRLSCRWLTACVQKGAKMSVQKLLRVEAYLALNEWELIKWELISAEKRKRKRRQRETVLVSRPLRSLYQEINTICSNKGQFSRTCWHRLSAETLWFSSRPPRIATIFESFVWNLSSSSQRNEKMAISVVKDPNRITRNRLFVHFRS